MDAHQFLAVAEELVANARKDSTQVNVRAICRTAVGRAYYALFLLAREFVNGLGVETRSVPSIHVTLAESLQHIGVLSLMRIGETRDALRAHGGELTLTSTGDAGTVFRMTLPDQPVALPEALSALPAREPAAAVATR